MSGILDNINSPGDLKDKSISELEEICEEIRTKIINAVSNNGGHLASNLGVVELTVALGYVFNLPKDSIVWDVGHQSYPYKILTGRGKEFDTIRKKNGLSGFPCREESEYDVLTSGHSSTSISAALGISEANRLKGNDDFVVSVIGDGALSGGLAYEGLNNAGRLHKNFIVIVNDNNMSISKNVGSMARYLTYMRTKPGYIKVKMNVRSSLGKIPFLGKKLTSIIRSIKRWIKHLFYNTTIFEDLGFEYYGPFDGHKIKDLIEAFQGAKLINKPVLLHVMTNKGKGYKYAEESPSEFHGISGFDIETGNMEGSSVTFSDVFGDTLCDIANTNKNICAITAAMRIGTGLAKFREKYKDRFYDVGIAEEHAVTFAGGLAVKNMIPVFAVYSTFLQRAYDEMIHDISLQNTKAILAIDRAGVVGDDGKTHQGVFDIAYMQTIPNSTVFSPSYFDELSMQLRYLVDKGEGLCAIRYPRGKELYKPSYFKASCNNFEIYNNKKAEYAIVTFGRNFSFVSEALEKFNYKEDVKLIKINRIIPLDEDVISYVKDCKVIIFYEEGISTGGIGEHFCYLLYKNGFRGEFILKGIDHAFIEHAPMFSALDSLGFSPSKILSDLKEIFIRERYDISEKKT